MNHGQGGAGEQASLPHRWGGGSRRVSPTGGARGRRAGESPPQAGRGGGSRQVSPTGGETGGAGVSPHRPIQGSISPPRRESVDSSPRVPAFVSLGTLPTGGFWPTWRLPGHATPVPGVLVPTRLQKTPGSALK